MRIHTHLTILFLIAILYSFNLSASQSIKGFLHQHKVIEAQISRAEKHRYQITLTKDQFAEFRLVQKGVDLMITTFNTKGNKIETFDLTGNFGEEIATITSDVSGTYWLEIQTFSDTQLTTNYSLELKHISAKAQTLSKKVAQYLARWDSATLPGLAIAVSKDGKLFYSKGVGLANLEYAIPINSSTVFDVASISKQFTAFSILLLAEEGKLSIDDEVSKYIPELHDFGHKITLRHLLNHTSGLRQEDVLRSLAGWREGDITTPKIALKLITMQNELNFVPGEKFEYSNSGYFLLAQIVSRVSGQSFATFTKERIFIPLAMNSSSFPSDYRTVIKNKAYSYRLSADGFSKSILNSTMIGSTGLNTTVEDLAKWAKNFEQPKVGNINIIHQMRTPGILNNGETTNYALGQVVNNFRGEETFGHGGTISGFRTFILRIPSQRLSVVVLANFPHLNPLNIAYEIADFYLSALPKTTLTGELLSKNTLKSYSGDFEILGGIRYTITQNNQRLYLQIMGGAKQPLTHLVGSEFTFGNEGRKLKLSPERMTLIEGIYGGQTIIGSRVKVPSIDTSPLDLTDFTGRFYSPELDTTYDLVIENNQLKAQNLRSEVYLTPYDIDTFSSNSGFFLRAKFVRNKDSEITELEVSGVSIHKLKFMKE